MPPYLNPIPIRYCSMIGCTRRAVVELYFDKADLTVGDFCATHGQAALARAEEVQAATRAAADACPDDPDGQHHVGCGCDYTSPDDPEPT